MKHSVLITFLCSLGMNVAFALPFTIIPDGPLPNEVIVGQSVFYTVTNNTKRVLTDNAVAYLPLNVVQVLTDPIVPDLCGSEFTLQPFGHAGDSCTLEVQVLGPVKEDCNDPAHHLIVCASDDTTCAGTNPANALNVSKVYQPLAYIADDDIEDAVTICPVLPTGSFDDANCALYSNSTFHFPIDVVVNDTDNVAYVLNAANGIVPQYSVSVCPLDANGFFTTCVAHSDATFFVRYGGLRLSRDGTILYVTNSELPIGIVNTVSVCNLDTAGNVVGDCIADGGRDSLGDPTFYQPNGRIAFSLDGTIAYIPNFKQGLGSSNVSVCEVIQSGPNRGQFQNCVIRYNALLSDLQAADLSADGKYIYLANNFYNNNDPNTVVICELTADRKDFITCVPSIGEDQYGNRTFYFDTNSTNLFTSNPLLPFGYVPNGCVPPSSGNPPTCEGQSTISICSIIPGDFGPCVTNTASSLLVSADSVWVANILIQ